MKESTADSLFWLLSFRKGRERGGEFKYISRTTRCKPSGSVGLMVISANSGLGYGIFDVSEKYNGLCIRLSLKYIRRTREILFYSLKSFRKVCVYISNCFSFHWFPFTSLPCSARFPGLVVLPTFFLPYLTVFDLIRASHPAAPIEASILIGCTSNRRVSAKTDALKVPAGA